MADLTQTLQRQGENIFAVIDGTGRRITGGLPTDIDISALPTFSGGTTGGDLSFRDASRLFDSREADRLAREQAITSQTLEQRVGTVEAFRQKGVEGLGRELTNEDRLLLSKAGLDVGDTSSLKTFAQKFREENGRFPTREEQIAAGVSVAQPSTTSVGPSLPQAGQKISGPSGLQGLTENEIARTSGKDIYRRDLSLEQQLLGEYTSRFGVPDFTNPDSVKKFNDFVYAGIGRDSIPNRGEAPSDTSILQTRDLSSSSAPAFKSLNDSALSGLGVLGLTPSQRETQNIIDQARTEANKLLGEDEFRIQKGRELGLPELSATQRDLSSQLLTIKNEAAAIPILLEKGAEGRGITTAILDRQTRAALRDNAIKALTISSLIEANRGNIASANELVELAVAEKYGSIKKRLEVAKLNLDLLRDSPLFKAEEKLQAIAMKKILEDQESEADRLEQEERGTKKLAIEVALNNPDIDALTLNSIANAPDLLAASQIAAPYLQEKENIEISSSDTAGSKAVQITPAQLESRRTRISQLIDEGFSPEAARVQTLAEENLQGSSGVLDFNNL